MLSKSLRIVIVLAFLTSLTPAAEASFHFMQIEQVIGGVCGDATAQAIQLRMRSGGQNLVASRQLIARDATGANPVVLITFPSNVASSTAGSRILIVSSQFASIGSPAADFTLTNLIPESYLAAGRLTFEDGSGTIYWSLSWGGAGYTGSTTGATTNDADGTFGPSFAAALPSSTEQALQFQGAANSLSTNNAADYAVTSGAATFTNNAGTTGTLDDCPVFTDGFESGDLTAWTTSVSS